MLTRILRVEETHWRDLGRGLCVPMSVSETSVSHISAWNVEMRYWVCSKVECKLVDGFEWLYSLTQQKLVHRWIWGKWSQGWPLGNLDSWAAGAFHWVYKPVGVSVPPGCVCLPCLLVRSQLSASWACLALPCLGAGPRGSLGPENDIDAHIGSLGLPKAGESHKRALQGLKEARRE